jgi:putative addiction module component (TIGR02574 family)
MPVFDEVLDAARSLSPNERMRLADALWDEVPLSEWPLPSRAWIAEAQRRSDDFDLGLSSATPWTEVRARARKKAGLDE